MSDESEAIVISTRTMSDPPAVVLSEAMDAAKALQRVLAAKPNKVMMGKEQYLEFEDWQTIGRFYGITAGEVGEPEYVNLDGVKGFRATSRALWRGEEISRATAYCMSDEEKWSTRQKYEWLYCLKSGGHSAADPPKSEIIWEDNPSKPGKKRPKRERVACGEEKVPLFQLASMAQTRANAKVLRNVLSWVAVMAGYRPTPVEELPEAERVSRSPEERFEKAVEDAREASEREPGSDDDVETPMQTECPHCSVVGQITKSSDQKTSFCRACRRGI